MTDPILGQVTMAAYGFTPPNYAMCNGQTMVISQNQALYSIIGIAYGGNGTTEFNLPDLRGRVPVGHDNGTYAMGAKGGVESVTLTEPEMPLHNHRVRALERFGNKPVPNVDRLFARTLDHLYSHASFNLVPLFSKSVSTTLDAEPHDNMDASTVISFMIVIEGIYPSAN